MRDIKCGVSLGVAACLSSGANKLPTEDNRHQTGDTKISSLTTLFSYLKLECKKMDSALAILV